MNLQNRKEVILSCKSKPYVLTFTLLRNVDSLTYQFKKIFDAKTKLKQLVEEEKEDIEVYGGYHAEITKRIYIESKKVA